jgi:hypothetical protein
LSGVSRESGEVKVPAAGLYSRAPRLVRAVMVSVVPPTYAYRQDASDILGR